MGEPNFSSRSLGEIMADINVLAARHPCPETAFFGDADPLAAGIDVFGKAAKYLRKILPDLKRLTCYARASTIKHLGRKNDHKLAAAGLNRVHIGLESGDAEILRFQRKGQSPEMVETVTSWLKEAGIEVSFYVLLGIGGQERWKEHAIATARLINNCVPAFVRIRRLWLYTRESVGMDCPLWKEVHEGRFKEQTPEGTVHELKLLLELLEPVETFFACDHANNFISINGMVSTDRQEMLEELETFLAQPENVRAAHYESVGSSI